MHKVKGIILGLVALGFLLFSQELGATEQHALAMHGVPKLAEGFTHFPYTNPNAPKGGTLKLGATGTFDSLNPFIVRGQPPLGLNTGYMSLVYEPLMARNWDEPFALYPQIAASLDMPEDRHSITFNLDPQARWSDGVIVTADDVLFSFTTLRDKGRPSHRTYYKKVISAEKLGERSVRFTFKPNADGKPDREMPLIMALMPILPKHDWEGREFNETTWHTPVGSGPYKVSAIDPGRSVTYARNPDYWGKDIPAQRGLYNFDTIKIDYYRDDSVALQAFKSGQFDSRRENNLNKWITAYDFPAAHDGRVTLETIPHHRTEPTTGFALNTRRSPFNDPALRHAVTLAFDSGWINRNLFHGIYKPTTSYFPNGELAAPALPDAAERAVLEPFRDQLPNDIFDKPVTLPVTDGSDEALRRNLKTASNLLQQAGYTLRDNKLYSPEKQAVTFEVILNDPTEEKIALTWTRGLERLGIKVTVRTLDSAQYQRRLASFDFDAASVRWFNSLSPGNEQSTYWSKQAADQPGSRNYPGIKNAVVDALATAIPAAVSREQLVATTHALDRVLMAGYYLVPFYYLGADTVAWWNAHLRHPDVVPASGVVLESWWATP